MKWSITTTLMLSSILFCGANLNSISLAVQRRDGSVSFVKSPRLQEVVTTFNGTNVPYAKYYFTILLPEDIGEPLQQIAIQQREGMEDIKFDLDKTLAFLGTRGDRQTSIQIKSVEQKEEGENNNTILITLAEPIAPGNTVTLSLKPKRNPRYGGVYLFGVIVYPAAKLPYGLYIG
ncbi:MAG: DUF2808 domain-containing protein, partial [Cyanobacteria bacterium J083]